MSKQIYLHIPEPCHEDWEAMTPVQQGRFCQSCSKQVVDFSTMTDKQILDVMSKAAGKTCGRFSTDQLERPVVKEIPPMLKPHKLFLSAFIPAFIISGAALGQEKLQGKVVAKQTTECVRIVGDTQVSEVENINIKGRVLLENKLAATGAAIRIKGAQVATSADNEGRFALPFPADKQEVILTISYVGFKTKEVQISKKHPDVANIIFSEENVIMQGMLLARVSGDEDEYESPKERIEKQVTVKGKVENGNGDPVPFATIKVERLNKVFAADSAGRFNYTDFTIARRDNLTASSVGYKDQKIKIDYAKDNEKLKLILEPKIVVESVVASCLSTQSLRGMMGGLSYVTPVTVRDTAATFIKKVFKNEMFKVYPNPLSKGSVINFTFKKRGEYSLQVFDNPGKLYIQKDMLIDDTKQPYSITIPASMTAGVYYVKAINTSSHKQFVDKLIIE